MDILKNQAFEILNAGIRKPLQKDEIYLTRVDLADFTGTTHYTVSRILSDWTRKGWIAASRRQITVMDATSLRLRTETSLP